MARIKPTLYTPEYEALRKIGSSIGESSDCSVIAVAMVCGVSYEEAHAAMTVAGRKVETGAYVHQITNAVEQFGKSLVVCDIPSIIAQYQGGHNILKSVTTHHPARNNSVGRFWRNGKSYLFFSKGHVSAVVNGKVHDWAKDKAKRVWAIYEIV